MGVIKKASEIEISIETIQKAFRGIGNTMVVVAESLRRLRQEDYKEMNNWRKMHGMPMRRKRRKRKARRKYERGKRADSH